jgi:hypothetical protein
MNETGISKVIRITVAKFGTRLFRNQVGTYKLEDGRYLSSGLGPGTSDLIGWHPVTITQEMVGSKVAVFTACEVKKPRSKTSKSRLDKQRSFIEVVKDAGGIGFFATSEEEAIRGINGRSNDGSGINDD